MYKMTSDEIDRLKLEYDSVADAIIEYESDLKEYRTGNNRFISIDDIHIIEEQLFYMRGYKRLLIIRLYQQGVKV